MLAPDFIKERFHEGMTASVWFRNNPRGGSLRGRIAGWAEHKEECVSYVWVELSNGGELCVPFGEIYLSTLAEADWALAKADADLEKKAQAVNREQMATQIRQASSGLTGPG